MNRAAIPLRQASLPSPLPAHAPVSSALRLHVCFPARTERHSSKTDWEPGPFELTKNVVQTSVLVSNRAQASPDAARDPALRNKGRLNTLEAVKQIVRRYGIRGLYTGFTLHALRDTVGSGLYFGVYETVKQLAAKELGPDSSPFGGPMIAGAICSTVPWFCVS